MKDIIKQKKIIIAIIAIMLVAISLIVLYIANDFIILGKNNTTNVVINNKNITSNLKKEVIIENDIIYISKQDMANFFDKYIYEDEKTNQIITTYDDKVATMGFYSDTITINGQSKKTKAHCIKKDNNTYLPISEMLEVYNIEIKNNQESKVITIDSKNREQKKATITSELSVKSSTNFIAKTVERIKKGSDVIVVSKDNNWARIRTENGKLGYVKTSKLSNEVTIRENVEEKKQIEGKINLVWDYFSEYAKAPNRSGTKIEGVNVVSPAFFHIDENGKLQTNVEKEGEEYISWAHKNNYKVWPMISNAGDGMLKVTSNIMNDYNKRQELIENIVKVCKNYKIDGINVDFENMKKEDKDLYSRFIIELTPRMKELGLVTSVDVTAPDGGDTWSLCFDRNVIGDVADYIVFMAYDEYGVSSNKPGTTAGYDWVELSLNKFLNTEEIESNKIILAVPFYTRLWSENSNGKVTSKKVVSMKDIDSTLPKNIEKKWDDSLKQNYVEYIEGNTTKKMWIEDLKSLKEKISLIKQNNLAGVGAWAKDMENPGVWKLFKQELDK